MEILIAFSIAFACLLGVATVVHAYEHYTGKEVVPLVTIVGALGSCGLILKLMGI